MDITYNASSEEQLLQHFRRLDEQFLIILKAKVNLSLYVKKLVDKSSRLESWGGEELVGLLAFYTSIADKTIFITNLTVIAEEKRRGIGSLLLNHLKVLMIADSMSKISLEVDIENIGAIGFYKRHGFELVSQNGNQILMSLPV